jgi:CRISPR-associated endonuclease/helicase Cas3
VTAVTGTGSACLAEASFPDFFREVHGWEPFPWQTALLRRVVWDGWPALIDVPTGLGKTAVLDVAVFASALAAPGARRRVFLVVDRRVIVDQAHEHALRLQQALADPAAGTVCHAVAAALAAQGDDGPALDVTRMRGGVTWSWLWLERPDRHAIVTGTVDQVGSRLLFRGYGVGQQLRPVDAALVGTDSLIIIDEAHLSDPFLTTARDVTAIGQRDVIPGPVIVAMSASPGDGHDDAHCITAADEAHPVARKRLNAPKRLHLVSIPRAKEAATPDATAEALAHWATQIGGPGRVTGVIANTVAMARAVFSRLQQRFPEPDSCVLLTGRIRPADREYLMHDWYPRIRAGAARDPGRPVYVIATQAIEAGADIDLDGLVTQSAALPAIVQRLGRLNRRGGLDCATAVVVHADTIQDPVYGSAANQTWEWLITLAASVEHLAARSSADLGPGTGASPAALRACISRLPAAGLAGMRGAPPYVPVVSASTLDTWSRTSPVPHPDIPVAPFLHGLESGEPVVSVTWRADMPADPQRWHRSTDLIPPSADEAIELPLSAARRWLATSAPADTSGTSTPQMPADPLSDTETHAPNGSAGKPGYPAGGRRDLPAALRYEGPESSQPVTAGQIQPGDLLVVPADRGGCDKFGWNPGSTEPVTDLADFCGGTGKNPAVIRIGPALAQAADAVAPALAEAVRQLIDQVTADLEADTPDPRLYRSMLAQMPAYDGTPDRQPLPHQRVLRCLAAAGRLTIPQAVISGTPPLLTAGTAGWNSDFGAAGTSADPAARQVSLGAHQAAVRNRAGEFARNLRLTASLSAAVELAAAHHDEGKRDSRFQLMLHAGDHWQHQAAAAILAKSGMDPADRAAFRRAQRLSGYPGGMRHEALSARITAQILPPATAPGSPREAGAATDLDLVIHLIASHHGYARPLLPPVADRRPVDVTLPLHGSSRATISSAADFDWDGPARFARLRDQYGPWGLAFLETVVRLADIWCSARSEEA